MSNERVPYTELAGFEALYLEDSWVLSVTATPAKLSFVLDLVLTHEHPLYADPKPRECYCYRRGRIEFRGVSKVLWTNQGARPARDATGEVDYGNIDSLFASGATYALEGDWCAIEVESQPPVLEYD